jgi:hypothetical protein
LHIPDIKYGDRVELELNMNEVHIRAGIK